MKGFVSVFASLTGGLAGAVLFFASRQPRFDFTALIVAGVFLSLGALFLYLGFVVNPRTTASRLQRAAEVERVRLVKQERRTREEADRAAEDARNLETAKVAEAEGLRKRVQELLSVLPVEWRESEQNVAKVQMIAREPNLNGTGCPHYAGGICMVRVKLEQSTAFGPEPCSIFDAPPPAYRHCELWRLRPN